MGASASVHTAALEAEGSKPEDCSDVSDESLRAELARLRAELKKVKELTMPSDATAASLRIEASMVVPNAAPIKPPTNPSLMDNCLLWLPEAAVKELGLEPNMDDKGDSKKLMWFGRCWELRALLSMRKMGGTAEKPISDERKAELDAKLNDPEKKAMLLRIVARWKGAVCRLKNSLNILERLKWCRAQGEIKGTLVYAHGSGGCSWDNFRLCRMICRMGMLVIAPDGFGYPSNTAMGQMRHKDLKPLKLPGDDIDYWTGDLMYASGATGDMTYSTKADSVLENPEHYRDLYEKCYQLRRSELHFICGRLPKYVKEQGFFIGGTSEGAMTVARFDDQRYGEMLIGRFINSFSVEYCYFTPTPEAGQIGGQMDVPTLNIIGDMDEYFGPKDSVAKLVTEDEETGYGDDDMTGNAYNTLVKQGVEVGLVCVLEGGEHGPCGTHDNFLRPLFETFFDRAPSIWEIDDIWNVDPEKRALIEVKQEIAKQKQCITQLFVPKMKYPQKLALRDIEHKLALAAISGGESDELKQLMEEEGAATAAKAAETKAMLDSIRANSKKGGGSGFAKNVPEKTNFYAADKQTTVKHKKNKTSD